MKEEEKMDKTNDEWKGKLTSDEYHVMREQGTEAPFSGEYVHTKEKGMYQCRACGAELFSSDTKFDSGTGWPSFTEPVNREHVLLREDLGGGMLRTEVVCRRCDAHLGHVFDDGPKELHGKASSGKRFCVNSLSLKLEKAKE